MSLTNQPYFVLKGNDGEILGRSVFFSSEAAMESGIWAVKDYACKAPIIDLTQGKRSLLAAGTS